MPYTKVDSDNWDVRKTEDEDPSVPLLCSESHPRSFQPPTAYRGKNVRTWLYCIIIVEDLILHGDGIKSREKTVRQAGSPAALASQDKRRAKQFALPFVTITAL